MTSSSFFRVLGLQFPWMETESEKKKKEVEQKWNLVKYEWKMGIIPNLQIDHVNLMKHNRTTIISGEKIIEEKWEWINTRINELPKHPDSISLDTEPDTLVTKVLVDQTLKCAIGFVLIYSWLLGSSALHRRSNRFSVMMEFIKGVQNSWDRKC